MSELFKGLRQELGVSKEGLEFYQKGRCSRTPHWYEED